MRAEFDRFVLDLDQRTLSRGGTRIHVSPKAFALLELFLRNAPNAVAKEAIYEKVWGETFVEEANIPNLISDLRTALADDGRRRLIQTVHKYGYRFAADVRWAGQPAPAITRCCLVWGSREFGISEGENILGRDRGGAVAIDSAGVSRKHAKIFINGNEARIEDLGSKNGTFVNGHSAQPSIDLRDGDTILLGTVSLTFHQSATEDTTLTRAPAG